MKSLLMDRLADEPDDFQRRSTAREYLQSVDWSAARSDVSPFLERRQDADLVDRGVLLALLKPRRGS